MREEVALAALEPRLGPLHVRQRLGLERDYEAHVFRKGTHFFHIENWYSIHGLIRGSLRLVGLHGRGRRNALAIEVRRNQVPLPHLPAVFDGFTVLQLSDLHIDMNAEFVDALIERVRHHWGLPSAHLRTVRRCVGQAGASASASQGCRLLRTWQP
jgi:hypothetical protein